MVLPVSCLGRLCALLSLLAAAAGCSRKQPAHDEPTSLRYFGSNGQVTMVELAEDLGYLAPLKLQWVGNVLGGPESIQAVSLRNVDFGTAAIGSVIKLIAAGAPVKQVIATSGIDDLTWGGYFVVEDSPIHSARDLIGKQIAVNTLGAHAEFMIREYLTRGGLSPAEIAQVAMVVIPPINGEQTLRQGQVQVAGLSGVFRDRAMQRGGLRVLFSDRGLFGHFNSVNTVFHNKFIAEHPNTMRKFVEGTARAIEWARASPADVVRARMRQVMQRRNRGEDASLVQNWHSVGIKSRGGVLNDSDIQIWLDWLVANGHIARDKIKDLSTLYTSEFHPYRDAASAAPRARQGALP